MNDCEYRHLACEHEDFDDLDTDDLVIVLKGLLVTHMAMHVDGLFLYPFIHTILCQARATLCTDPDHIKEGKHALKALDYVLNTQPVDLDDYLLQLGPEVDYSQEMVNRYTEFFKEHGEPMVFSMRAGLMNDVEQRKN